MQERANCDWLFKCIYDILLLFYKKRCICYGNTTSSSMHFYPGRDRGRALNGHHYQNEAWRLGIQKCVLDVQWLLRQKQSCTLRFTWYVVGLIYSGRPSTYGCKAFTSHTADFRIRFVSFLVKNDFFNLWSGTSVKIADRILRNLATKGVNKCIQNCVSVHLQLYLVFIHTLEIWIFSHYLGLGHETMECAVCLANNFHWFG